MEVHGPRKIDGKNVYELFVPRLGDWPEKLELPSSRFVLLLAASSRHFPTQALDHLVKTMLDQGAISICALGPCAKQIELAFDMEIVARQMAAERSSRLDTLITTTSHDSLPEAVFFFLQCASPASRYGRTCPSWLSVVVGDRPLFRRMRQSLAAHERLSKVASDPT